MAEKSEGFVNWEDPYLSQATGYPDEEEQGVGISDYAKSIGRGAVSALVETPLTLASQALRSAGANKTSLFLDTLSDVAGETAKENLTDTMSPEAKRRAGAAFAFPEEGQASVWEDPISSIGLKAAGALPSLIASAFPAMRIAKAFGAAAGALAGGAVAGGMNAAEVYQDIKEEIQKLPDAKLREQNDMYRELRGMGVDEAEARAQVVSTISGYKPIIVGAISALTSGGFGLEGMLAKTASKEVAKKGLVKGGAEGLVKETGQEASESLSSKYASETALEEGNIKPFDWQKIIEATIEGGVVGGVLGGGVGGITNIGGDGKAAPKVQQTDASPLDPTTKFALDQKTQEQTTQPPPPPPAGQSAAVTPGVTPPNTEGQEATPPTGEQAPPAPPEPSRAYTFFYNEALKRLEKKGIEVTPEIADELSQRVTDAVGASKDTKARWSALGTILGDLTKRFTPAPAQQQADQAAIIEGLKVLDEKTPPKPEPKSVLDKQVEMLVKGERDAVFIPSSTPEKDRPRKPNGFRSVPVKGGLIYFNQGVFSEGQILKASRNGKLNEILPYGPTTNVQAAADVVQGADPRMVQVIKDNVPVAEAVSSTKTVDQDAAAMAAQAPADATVVIRDSVDEALAERDAAREAEQQEPIVVTPELRAKWEELGTRTLPNGRRVVPNLSDEAIIANEMAELEEMERQAQIERQRAKREELKAKAEKAEAKAEEKKQPVLEVKDAKASKKKGTVVQKKKDDLVAAKEIFDAHAPTPAEVKAGKAYSRQAAITRARKMLDAAKRAKIKIPSQWRDGVPEHLGFLLMVKKFDAFVSDPQSKPEDVNTAVQQFLSDEFYARQGEWDKIKESRQVEGAAQAKKKDLDEGQRYDDDTKERGEINVDKMAATTGETEDERVGRSYALVEENPDQTEVFESGFVDEDEVTEEVTIVEENIEEKLAARRAEGQFLKTEEAPAKAIAVEKKVGRPKLQVDKPKVEGKITLTKKAREVVAKASKRGRDSTPPTVAKTVTKGEGYFMKRFGEELPKSFRTGMSVVADVIHGTTKLFDQFSKSALGSNTKAPSARMGFFFANEGETSNNYTRALLNDPVTEAEIRQEIRNFIEDGWYRNGAHARNPNYNPNAFRAVLNREMALTPGLKRMYRALESSIFSHHALLKEGEEGMTPAQQQDTIDKMYALLMRADVPDIAPRSILARIVMENPFVHDFNKEGRLSRFSTVIEKAKAAGHDGVILRNVTDGGRNYDDIFVVFEPEQISTRFNPERDPLQVFPSKRKAPSEAAARALAEAYDIPFDLITDGKYDPQTGIEIMELIEGWERLSAKQQDLLGNMPLEYGAALNAAMDEGWKRDPDLWLDEKFKRWEALPASEQSKFEEGFIQFLYTENAPAITGNRAPASMTQEDAVLQGMLIDPITEKLMPALQVTTVAKIKPFLHNFDKIENPVLREVTKFIWGRIDERIPNMKVMLMTLDQIARIHENADAFYTRVGQTDVIVLAAEKMADPNYVTAVLTHEAVHGMTSLGIDSDPAFYNTIKLISDEVRSVIGDQRLSDLYGIKLKPEINEKLSKQYGFTDAHEFIAEALSNPAFQKMLADIQISDKLAKQLGMQTWSNRSIWSAIVNTVRKLLNMPPNTFTALEGVMRVTDSIMAKQETLPPTAQLAPPGSNPKLITREAAQRSANRWNPRVKGKTEAEARAQYEAGVLTAREAAEAAGLANYKIIDKRTGAVVGETNSLARAMWMRDNRDDAQGGYRYRIETDYPAWARGEQDGRAISREAAQRAAQGFADAVTPTSIGKRKALLGLSTLDQIRQWYRGTFVNGKGEDVLEKLISNIQRIRPFADSKRERGEQLAQRFMDFAAKNREAANEFADIANSVTMLNAQLFGANEHWGSDRRDGWQARAVLPDLQRRFAAIEQANPGVRELYQDMVAYYRDTQNEITRQLVDNILAEHNADLSDADRASLTKKVMEGTLDDAAKELVNNATIFNALKDARALRLVQGDYFPLMRHGEFVVQTRDSIGDLHGGVEVTPGVIEFTGKTEAEALKKAEAFAKRTTKGPGFTQADGVPLVLSGPTATEVSSDSSEFKFRVKVQLDGLHMFDTQAEAESFIQSEKGKFAQISEAPLLKRDDGTFGGEMSNSALAAIAKSISARDNIPKAQREMMLTALKQAAVRQMAGNRVQKRALPRRGFIGASDDLARNTLVYAEASTRYLGKLRYMPLVREAFSEMQKLADAAKYSKDHQAMEQLLNHLRNRVDGNVITEQEASPLIRDVMTMSSIDKLASPAYSLIQTLQPTMMTLPYLSGRYGIGQAGAAIAQAYRVVGAGAAIGGGFRNTKQSIVQFAKTALDSTDVLGSIMSNVAKEKDGKQLTAVLNELVERGILDKNAGMEVAEVVTKGRGKWAMGLSKVDRITRQLPAAIEQVNRAVSAVAAYRLAVEKGESHEKAMSRAFDTVANTQGDYSASNAPAIFNHPIWRISLQFKKYGQMYYAMFGDMLYRAFKDASPEERAVARKQLAHVIGVQILAAGALGIPGMEVIKLGVMAAAALGIGGGYDDFEREVREAAVNMGLGKYWGELLTKGVLPRAVGLDLSSRLGADSLLTFGEPKKYDETNVGAYLTNIFVGAPGSLIVDQFKAARGFADAVRTGDSSQAWKSAELLPMPKFISDLAKASRKAIEGQTSSKSGRQTEEPIGLGTAAINAFGLRTADQAEKGAAKGAQIAEGERRREVTGSMTKLKNQFAEAKNEGERVRILARLKQLNSTLPEDERQTPAQFRAFAKKFQKDKAAGMVSGGARYRNEAEKAAADRAAAVYNYTR